MTDTTTTPADPTSTTPPDGGTDDRLSAEAARHRKEKKEAEAERDAARAERDAALEQVKALHRDALAGKLAGMFEFDGDGMHHRVFLRNPADLFDVGGVAPDDLLDEAGHLDEARVLEAITALHTARPYLFQGAGGGIRAELSRGQRYDASRRQTRAGGNDWGDALKGATKPR